MSHLPEIFNGLLKTIYDDIELITKTISVKYNLPESEVKELAFATLNEQKIKTIKLQKRAPKQAGKVPSKPRKRSGYMQFCKDKRKEIEALLVSDPGARTFEHKGEKTALEFGEKGPTFTQITKKLGSLWAEVSEEEKHRYEIRAKEEADRERKEKEEGVDSAASEMSSHDDESTTSKSETKSSETKSEESDSSTKMKPINKKKAEKAAEKEPVPVTKKEKPQALPKKGGKPNKK